MSALRYSGIQEIFHRFSVLSGGRPRAGSPLSLSPRAKRDMSLCLWPRRGSVTSQASAAVSGEGRGAAWLGGRAGTPRTARRPGGFGGVAVTASTPVPVEALTLEHMGDHRVTEIWCRKLLFIKHKSGGHYSLFKRIPHGNPQN